MKKIYLILTVVVFPFLSFGQSTIDISFLENFDVQAATSCDSGLPSCQKQVADLQALIVVLLQQIIALNLADQVDIVVDEEQVPYYEEKKYKEEYAKTPSLSSGKQKTFRIRNGEINVDEDDHAYYREIARLFAEIVPEHVLDDFYRIIFVDSKDVYYAAQVRQSIESRNGVESEDWQLYINMDDVTLENDQEYNQSLQTLVHETGHALLTNSSQLDFFVSKRSCNTLFIGELKSCAKKDSYYNALLQFWSDDHIEWTEDYKELFEDDQQEADEELQEYYADNKKNFITDYAATSIHEDAAETIAFYATGSFPTGLLTLAEEKIVALFDFPEMRTLKNIVKDLLQ